MLLSRWIVFWLIIAIFCIGCVMLILVLPPIHISDHTLLAAGIGACLAILLRDRR